MVCSPHMYTVQSIAQQDYMPVYQANLPLQNLQGYETTTTQYNPLTAEMTQTNYQTDELTNTEDITAKLSDTLEISPNEEKMYLTNEQEFEIPIEQTTLKEVPKYQTTMTEKPIFNSYGLALSYFPETLEEKETEQDAAKTRDSLALMIQRELAKSSQDRLLTECQHV
jgi:hypothetical protein